MKKETIDKMELIVQANLLEMQDLNNIEIKLRKDMLAEVLALTDKINENERLSAEILDKEEKQHVAMLEYQLKKDQFKSPYNRVVDVSSKVVIPMATFLIGVWLHREDKFNIFEFEELGRITSKVGKDFRLWLPNFKK